MSSLLLSIFMLSFLVSGTALGNDQCVLSSLASNQSSFGSALRKEVEAACDTFSDHKISEKCCAKSNKFIGKNGLPCSEGKQLKMQIELARAACDQFDEQYQPLCIDRMLGSISNKRVQDLRDECWTKAHKVFQETMDLVTRSHLDFGNPYERQDSTMGDCEDSKTKNLRKQLDIELVNAPADPISCSETRSSSEKATHRVEQATPAAAPNSAAPVGNTQ